MWNFILELIVFIITISLLVFCVWRVRLKRLKTYTSPILGLIEIWEKYNGEKVLTINKYPHGISVHKKSVNKSYWYYIAKEALKHIQKKSKPQVLFLGLGANTSSSIIANQNQKAFQTIVEIDKYIIAACHKFFGLSDMKRVTVIQADAYKLIHKRDNFRNKFDVIVVDIFTGMPPYVSTKTNKPSFIEKLLLWSKKDGIIIFNRPANIKADREDTKQLHKYLKTLFKNVRTVYISDPRGYKNDIVTATFL